jgi:hypothetical protein
VFVRSGTSVARVYRWTATREVQPTSRRDAGVRPRRFSAGPKPGREGFSLKLGRVTHRAKFGVVRNNSSNLSVEIPVSEPLGSRMRLQDDCMNTPYASAIETPTSRGKGETTRKRAPDAAATGSMIGSCHDVHNL